MVLPCSRKPFKVKARKCLGSVLIVNSLNQSTKETNIFILRLSVPQVPEIENAFLPLTLLFSMIPLYTDQDLQLKYMCIQVILADN